MVGFCCCGGISVPDCSPCIVTPTAIAFTVLGYGNNGDSCGTSCVGFNGTYVLDAIAACEYRYQAPASTQFCHLDHIIAEFVDFGSSILFALEMHIRNGSVTNRMFWAYNLGPGSCVMANAPLDKGLQERCDSTSAQAFATTF